VTARHDQVEDAQILEAEGVARLHGRACHFSELGRYRTNNEHVNGRKSGYLPAAPSLGPRHHGISHLQAKCLQGVSRFIGRVPE
jgi:hypothetical protein